MFDIFVQDFQAQNLPITEKMIQNSSATYRETTDLDKNCNVTNMSRIPNVRNARHAPNVNLNERDEKDK